VDRYDNRERPLAGRSVYPGRDSPRGTVDEVARSLHDYVNTTLESLLVDYRDHLPRVPFHDDAKNSFLALLTAAMERARRLALALEAKNYGQTGGLRLRFTAWSRESTGGLCLAAAGILGSKFYDAGSRAAGEGTRNYVVFDESIMKVLGRE